MYEPKLVLSDSDENTKSYDVYGSIYNDNEYFMVYVDDGLSEYRILTNKEVEHINSMKTEKERMDYVIKIMNMGMEDWYHE